VKGGKKWEKVGKSEILEVRKSETNVLTLVGAWALFAWVCAGVRSLMF
jgi:hypothetical protein